MRNTLRWLLQYVLAVLARLTIARFKPVVVGVTGSAGKTSTRDAIYAVIRSVRTARKAEGNLNSEFGFPLVVFGEYGKIETELVSNEGPKGHKLAKGWFWLKVVIRAFVQLLFGRKTSYPSVLVLEYGADKPGDIQTLLDIVRPHISVVTALGEIPVHVEAYPDVDAVAAEKRGLVAALSEKGTTILNLDDPRVFAMRSHTKAKVLTFGFGEGAQVRVTSLETRVEGERRVTPKPLGISFKIETGGSFVPVRVEGTLGKPQAYACAAAAAVGTTLGLNLVQIAEALSYHQAPSQRLRVVQGFEGSVILDDTYNASPVAMKSALEVLAGLKAKRKIAVLGDMRELGKYGKQAHEEMGRLAAQVADVILFSGEESKAAAEIATAAAPHKTIQHVMTTLELATIVKSLLKAGDLVLIKASHSLHFDSIVDGVRVGRVVE